MWGLTKPRRGVFKPGGTPRLGVGAPRGLQICAPIADQALFATVNRTGPAKPTFIGTAGTVSPIRAGAGWAPNGSTTNTGCLSYKTVNVSGPISIEAWFVAGSSGINRAIAGFNDLADGTSGTADKALGLDFAGRAYAYVFDGGQKFATDTSQTFTQGRLVHLALTYDGTTLSLYVDGALKSTIAAASSYTGYTTPHLCCGSFNTGFGSTGTVDSILLVNMAYAAWTAAEVAGRYADPFGFLDFPDDDLFAMVVGAAAGAFSISRLASTSPASLSVRGVGVSRIGTTTPGKVATYAITASRVATTTPAKVRTIAASLARVATTTPVSLVTRAVTFARTAATTPGSVVARAVSLARVASTTPGKVVAVSRAIVRIASTTPAALSAAKAVTMARLAQTAPASIVGRVITWARLVSTSPAAFGSALVAAAVNIALFAAGRVARLARNLRSAAIGSDARNAKE